MLDFLIVRLFQHPDRTNFSKLHVTLIRVEAVRQQVVYYGPQYAATARFPPISKDGGPPSV